MRLDVLLLASLPSSLGMQLAYSPPPALMAKVAAQDDCVLPGDYEVRDFAGKSNDTGSTLASFDFKFVDPATKVETACHFNETSVSGTPSALTPRYPCEHGEVEFIWEGNKTKLWMIERVCPGPDGYDDPFNPSCTYLTEC
jgi:hypothetical protein